MNDASRTLDTQWSLDRVNGYFKICNIMYVYEKMPINTYEHITMIGIK